MMRNRTDSAKAMLFRFLYEVVGWAGVMVLFYLFWLVFGNGHEPTIYYSEQ